jgi:hypothetical protein
MRIVGMTEEPSVAHNFEAEFLKTINHLPRRASPPAITRGKLSMLMCISGRKEIQ